MELQAPSLLPIFLLAGGFMIPILVAVFSIIAIEKEKLRGTVLMACGVLGVISIVTGLVLTNVNNNELDTKFAQQLTEQYNATSNRTFTQMKDTLSNKGEVSTTLTRDGEKTDVFIKKVYTDDRSKLKLLLTVYKDGALYPEAG